MKVRCQRCDGTRRIMALGGIKKECDACKGSGFMDEPEEIILDESKRRGRKPRDEKNNEREL